MYILSIITRLFHFLPGELSHGLALGGLKTFYRLGLLDILIGKKNKNKEIISNPNNVLTYKNKLGIAAGLDKDGEYIDCLSALGVGFIEVGTVTPKRQYGNPKPRLFRN